MQDKTNEQYDKIIERCHDIFIKKTRDYGTSWRVYRTISVVDQIYIKAKRIRTIQEKKEQKILEDAYAEFTGIINYSVIGLIQLDLATDEVEDLPVETVHEYYSGKIIIAKKLMEDKNHDYGEAWREMSIESFVDLIMAKLLRIKNILANEGLTEASEGIDSNYFDILNYAVFALILTSQLTH